MQHILEMLQGLLITHINKDYSFRYLHALLVFCHMEGAMEAKGSSVSLTLTLTLTLILFVNGVSNL